MKNSIGINCFRLGWRSTWNIRIFKYIFEFTNSKLINKEEDVHWVQIPEPATKSWWRWTSKLFNVYSLFKYSENQSFKGIFVHTNSFWDAIGLFATQKTNPLIIFIRLDFLINLKPNKSVSPIRLAFALGPAWVVLQLKKSIPWINLHKTWFLINFKPRKFCIANSFGVPLTFWKTVLSIIKGLGSDGIAPHGVYQTCLSDFF